MNKKKNLQGFAGELFVQAELNMRGYCTSKVPDAEKSYDLIAKTSNGYREVQVKTIKFTRANDSIEWPVGEKVNNSDDNIIWVFVLFSENSHPRYFICDGKYVKENVNQHYIDWLNTPGRNGKPHNPSKIRNFILEKEIQSNYEDKWDIFE